MPSYSLANWVGNQSPQRPWSQQTDSRHFAPVPVGGQRGDEASRTELDASMGKNSVVERVDNQKEMAVKRVEESQLSSVFSMSSGYQNTYLVAQSTNVSITLDNGSSLQSTNGASGVASLQHETCGFKINASVRDAFDERVGALPYQHVEQRDPHIPRLATETRTPHTAQTIVPSDLLSHDRQMLNTIHSGRDVGGNESGMDIGVSADLNDITRIFDADADVTIIDSRTEESTQTIEEYVPTTIEPHLLWAHAADSPASFDIPTDIFHTPSRSPSKSHDSLFTPTPSPSPAPAPVPRRVVMSHIAVPPLPPFKKYRPIRPGVQTHMSMGEALRAAMINNGALQTISSQKRIRAESRSESVASFRPPTGVVKNKKSGHNEIEKERERGAEVVPYRRDVSGERAPSVNASVSTFVSTRRPLPRLQRREFGYASYDAKLDLVHLTICGIPHDPQDIVSANTRFVRQPERVPATPKSQWGCYSIQADADDYVYTQKWSSSCESLKGIEEALCTGEFWLDVDGSNVEEWEEDGVVAQLEEDDDDEIMFIGRSGPSQSQPQPLPPKKVASKPAKSTGVPNRTIHAGTPVNEDDEVEIIELSLSSPKQSRPKSKPKARPRTDSSASSLGEVRDQSGAYRPPTKPGEGGRAMLPPKAPHPPRPRILSQEYPPTQPSKVIQKRSRAVDDEEDYRPSAKALGKRRAMSPGPRDAAGVRHVRPPLSPSLSKSHAELTKKSQTPKTPKTQSKSSSKPPQLLAMADLIVNTMKSHPPPPQFFPDPLESPLPIFSPNDSPSTPQLTNTTTETSNNYSPPTPPSGQPNFTIDSTAILNSSSDFLAPHTSSSPFSIHAIARGGNGPFLAGDSYLHSPTENFGFPSPEKQVKTNGVQSGSLEWSPGNGTINPALLGGHSPEKQELPAPSPPSQVVPSAYLALVAYDSDTPPPSPSPPPHASSQPQLASPRRRSPSPTTNSPSPPLSHLTSSSPEHSLVDSNSSKSSASEHHANDPPLATASTSDTTTRSVRVSKQPRMPNGMIATADLHLDGDSDGEWSPAGAKRPRKKVKAKRMFEPRTYGTDDSASEHEEGSSSNSKAIVAQKPPVSVAKLKSKPRAKTDWPLDQEDSFCHQCRSTTFRRKYICACTKKYCIRCLSLRYDGEVTSTFPCPTFKCPCCRGMCTCDVCTKKRGEEYIPLWKSQAKKISVEPRAISVTEKKNVPDSVVPATRPRLGGKTNLPVPTISGPVQYWATIYGMDGERIGNAFVGNDNEDLVLPRFLESASSQQSQPRNRIYVGETQDSWGLGDQYFVKDLNPVPWYERNNGPNERIYVGAKAPLSWLSRKKPKALRPYEEPLLFDEEFSSPLSFLSESEDDENINETGAGEGELHQGHGLYVAEADFEMAVQEDIDHFVAKGPSNGFSPDSLADTDVARAISLGLIACGMVVQLSSC